MCASRLHVSFESTIRTIEISNARVRILRRLHDENSTVLSKKTISFAQQKTGYHQDLSFLSVLEMLVQHETILQLFIYLEVILFVQKNERKSCTAVNCLI
jgi:hypothetical protein